MLKYVFAISVLISFSVYGMNCKSCAFAEDANVSNAKKNNSCEKDGKNQPCQSKDQNQKMGLDELLSKLNKQTEGLKSYDANVVSAFVQPLLEARTVRRGKIFYVNRDDESKLRINFLTRQDDEAKPQADRQDYLFDGVWLVRANYTTGHVEKRQIAEEDQPEDVLGLVSANFPLIGFSNVDKLKEDFEVELIEHQQDQDNADLMHVRLVPRQDNKFAEEYSQIDFWVDKNIMLPVRIDSVTVEDDIYQLSFEDPNVNKEIDKVNFEFDYPADFTVEVKKLD